MCILFVYYLYYVNTMLYTYIMYHIPFATHFCIILGISYCDWWRYGGIFVIRHVFAKESEQPFSLEVLHDLDHIYIYYNIYIHIHTQVSQRMKTLLCDAQIVTLAEIHLAGRDCQCQVLWCTNFLNRRDALVPLWLVGSDLQLVVQGRKSFCLWSLMRGRIVLVVCCLLDIWCKAV